MENSNDGLWTQIFNLAVKSIIVFLHLTKTIYYSEDEMYPISVLRRIFSLRIPDYP